MPHGFGIETASLPWLKGVGVSSAQWPDIRPSLFGAQRTGSAA